MAGPTPPSPARRFPGGAARVAGIPRSARITDSADGNPAYKYPTHLEHGGGAVSLRGGGSACSGTCGGCLHGSLAGGDGVRRYWGGGFDECRSVVAIQLGAVAGGV